MQIKECIVLSWAGSAEPAHRFANPQKTTIFAEKPRHLATEGTYELHYIHKDHLGSWTTITDDGGQVIAEQSFDAWGNMRNAETWSGSSSLKPMFDRGYTGHEQLSAFGLINMNGRMYDPTMSSFLSVDNFVQAPDNSQNFNRYAYCLNNPLKYTDPSGWRMLGAMNYSNPFHENWGVNFAEHVVTSHEAREILWNMGISVGTWMMGNEVCGMSGGGLGSDYTVDRKGYVENMGDNDMTYDILYTSAAYADGDYSNGLIVYDLSILAGLTEDRADYRGNYGITTSKKDAFNVFYFMAENTDVEWAIDGYRVSGSNEYVVRTTHEIDKVVMLRNIPQYSESNQVFKMHSHPGVDGTRGAGGNRNSGDIYNIETLYYKFRNAGMELTYKWFKYEGKEWTIFPKHYIYHPYCNILYNYTPMQSSVFIRKVKKSNDLYRNLGL